MLGAPITRWIQHWARTKPDQPAIVFEHHPVSWRTLNDTMDAWSRTLITQGVRPGDRIACLLNNRAEFYFTFLAAARARAVFVPINTQLTAGEVSHLVADADAAAVICETRTADLVGNLDTPRPRKILNVDQQDLAAPADSSRGRPSGAVESLPSATFDDPLAILYTSGTTGRPKGAVFAHSQFHFAAEALCRAFDLTQSDRHLINAPLYFTGGVLVASQPVLLSGGTIVLSTYQSPGHTLELIENENVTVYLAVPAILNLLSDLVAARPERLASLRVLTSGSAPTPRPLIEFYRAHGITVAQGYGLTEAGGAAAFLLPGDASGHEETVGRATMYTEIAVTRPDGSPAGPTETGELRLRGPSITSGYWRNPTATEDLVGEGGWITTGDLGTMDEDGYLTIVGRLKDVIITGGVNVYPAEVESVLSAHPDIVEVAVIGVPHATYGETVTAVVVAAEGHTMSLTQLREFGAAELAHYKLPRLLWLVDRLPRTASGKVRKDKIRNSSASELDQSPDVRRPDHDAPIHSRP